MTTLERPAARSRPVYLNLVAIRLPVPGIVSFLHRVSGALLFLVGIPFGLYALQASLASADSFAALAALFAHPLAKLATIVLAWAYFHHFCAGIRYLLLDMHIGDDLAPARRSSVIVFVVSLLLTLAVVVRIW